jgi:hypothetical protein
MSIPSVTASDAIFEHILAVDKLRIAHLCLEIETLQATLQATKASETGAAGSSTQLPPQLIESPPPGLCLQPRHDFPYSAPLAQPMAATPAGPPGGACQLVAGRADSDTPRLPTASLDDGETSSTHRPVTPPIVLTLDDIRLRSNVAGIGGGQACVKMKELRSSALAVGVWTVDLTHGAWPWQQLLCAASLANQKLIVGPGITSFTFSLIRYSLDANYRHVKNDSGERHVFEIYRADGTRCHLHYHKSGRMDTPYVLDAGASMYDTAPGIPQPWRWRRDAT